MMALRCLLPKSVFLHSVSRNVIRGICTSSPFQNTKICIVGSGPAGFYTAQQILKNPNVEVDIIEKLPVPFGLVRYGVAPDHPEVKNVINTFTNTASQGRCNFYGNITLGKDIALAELMAAYHGVVLAYGAESDRVLDIPGENLQNVIPARSFVGWYNGHPSYSDLSINLDVETAVVVGLGNVALDAARILLSPIHVLEKTDISRHSLDMLKKSKIRRVIFLGRRTALGIVFTIKEIREMIKLPDCRPILHREHFEPLRDLLSDLPRPRKRLLELLVKTALETLPESATKKQKASKDWELRFMRRPLKVIPDNAGTSVAALTLGINAVKEAEGETVVVPTDEEETIKCGLVLRSIGYRSIQVDPEIPFDHGSGVVPNDGGRVTGMKGLYCSGWVKTGPIGVIISTMNSSFDTGKAILDDLSAGILPSENKPGSNYLLELLSARGIRPVSFDDWKKIDQVEKEQGMKVGKPREKIIDIKQMLQLATAL